MKTLYANVSRPGVLTVLGIQDIQTKGASNLPLESCADVQALLNKRPDIDLVMFYLGHMPRKPVPRDKISDKLLRKLFRPYRKAGT